MKLTQVIAMLLCLLLTATLFVGCDQGNNSDNKAENNAPSQNQDDEKDEGSPTLPNTDDSNTDDSQVKEPSTIEEYIALAEEGLKNSYKMTTHTVQTLNGESVTTDEVCYGQGDYFVSFDPENATEIVKAYYDGVMYVNAAGIKRKANVVTDDLDDTFEILAADVSGILNFNYQDLQIQKNADGTTTLTGKDPKSADEYTPVQMLIILDSQYRVIYQKIEMVLTVDMGEMSYTTRIETEDTLEYGEEYAVFAPADADAYELVSFEELYMY